MLSFLPILFSFVVCFSLLGVFLWSGKLFVAGLFSLVFLVPLLIREVFSSRYRRKNAFLLFLISEALAFLGLFVTTLWFEDDNVRAISDWDGLPVAGCFILIHSSVLVTVFHKYYSCSLVPFGYLLGTIGLGALFIYLQFFEMFFCKTDLTSSSYYSASFCTVGLHFTHVVIGLILLSYIFSGFGSVSSYYNTLFVWYWHFVDLLWLVVYLVVYFI